MRIFAFSDWRAQPIGKLFEILLGLEEPVDLIVYAGDDIRRFGGDESNVFSELATHTELGQVLAVLGNDDLSDVKSVLEAPPVHDLHEEPFYEGDYVFVGQEGAIAGGPGYTLYSEDVIRDHLRSQYGAAQDKIPIVVSHVPPNGVLDIAQRFGQRHIGSTALRNFLQRENPAIVVCGHCHQFGGRSEEVNETSVINIASHDDPGSEGRYAIIEVEGHDAKVDLRTTEQGADHVLRKLSQVGMRRLLQFQEAGITELDDIDEDTRAELLELPGVYDWHVDMWLEEVEAIQNDELRISSAAEFGFLESDETVLLDIETDLDQSRIWLIGLYSYQEEEFTRIFEPDDEDDLLHEFIEYLEDHDAPGIVYYGNNRFDEACLKQRMEAHNRESGIELMEESFDLGIQVHNHLLGEFNRTNLDAIAQRIADYEYEYPEMDGFLVGSQYTKYLLDGTEPDWDKLLEYNRDDVFALKAVVDNLRELSAATE